MVRVFFDVDIGDAAAYREAVAEYTRFKDFCAVVGPQYGLSGHAEQLSGEDVQMLLEAYAADKSWAAKGQARGSSPRDIRAGRLVIELYDKEAPKAAENFRSLATGERGLGKASRKLLHYKGCRFHRIVQGFMCQSGDIVKGDGTGGDSIYGGKFNDDKGGLKLKHGGPGVVAMANSGKHSNTSQFYITFAAAPQCDGSYVVLGQVVEGLQILQRIDAEAASADGTPKVDVTIADCGVLP